MGEDVIGAGLTASLELFQDAIDQVENLEIIGYETKKDGSGSDVLVIEDSNVDKSADGHQITVDISEIFSKCNDEKSAERFAKVIDREDEAIVCEGVTRIVGYYSRTKNWNKSKIGELRDRRGENYALSGAQPIHKESRSKHVDAL